MFEISKKIFLLLSVLAIMITLYLRIDLVFSYLHDTGYGGFMLYCIYGLQSMMQNGFLYLNPEQSNFAIIQYSPLFYYICTGFAAVFQIEATEIYKLMVMARIFCLSCNMLGAYFFFLWLHNYFNVPRTIARIGGGLTLILLTSHFYTRVDSLFLLLWIISIYYFFQYISEPRPIQLWLTAAFCALNFFAKQNALSSIGFFVIAIYFVKGWKPALDFTLKTSVFGILYLALLLLNEDISFFYMNAFKGIKNGIGVEFWAFIKTNTLLWSSLLFFVIYTFNKFSQIKSPNYLILWTVIFFLFEAAFTLFKIGSSVNYLVPAELLILGLLFGSIWDAKKTFTSNRIYSMWALVLTVLFAFYENTMPLYNDLGYKQSARENYESQKELAGYLKNQLKSAPTEKVLFLDLHNYLNNFLPDQTVFATLCATYQCYETDPSLFNYTKFKDLLSHGKIGYIVAQSDQRPPFVFLGIDLKPFIEQKKMGRYTIYKFQSPKPFIDND